MKIYLRGQLFGTYQDTTKAINKLDQLIEIFGKENVKLVVSK